MKILSVDAKVKESIRSEILKAFPDDVYVVPIGHSLPDGVPADRSIMVTDGLPANELVEAALASGVCHIVQTSNPAFEEEISVAAQMICDPKQFIKAPRESVFSENSNGSNGALRIDFHKAIQKKEAIEQVKEFVHQVPRSKVIWDDVLVVADEMFTNAMFNAPETEGERRQQALDRSAKVSYDGEYKAHLFIYHDENRILLGCVDPFGTLDPTRVLTRINTCYKKGVSDSINMGQGGAGIGTYLMFNLSMSFYIAVQDKRASMVCCSFPLRKSARAKAMIPKNVHLVKF